jgi:hypothetical protein
MRREIGFLRRMRREVPSLPILVQAQGYLVEIEEDGAAGDLRTGGELDDAKENL